MTYELRVEVTAVPDRIAPEGSQGMALSQSVASKRGRLVAALIYACAVCAVVVSLRPSMPIAPPLGVIALGVPLIFRLVPRNWLYGMRTPRTLRTTEEIWYIQNTITGCALVIGGAIWLAIVLIR